MPIVATAKPMLQPRRTALVIDAERGEREALHMILAPALRVLAAADENEASDHLQSGAIDVVTLDLDLPGGRAVIDRALGQRTALEQERLARRRGGERSLAQLVETAEDQGLIVPGHGRRVGSYAALLARYAGLDDEACERVRMAGMLHDVGKIGVATAIAGGASGRALHALAGARLAARLDVSDVVEDAIRHHHERFDGRGVPARLAGDAIPLAARIVAVADAWDALIAPPFRPALGRLRGTGGLPLGPDDASLALRARSGTQLDPDLVSRFLAGVKAGESDLEADSVLWWLDDRAGRRVAPVLAASKGAATPSVRS